MDPAIVIWCSSIIAAFVLGRMIARWEVQGLVDFMAMSNQTLRAQRDELREDPSYEQREREAGDGDDAADFWKGDLSDK
jgi:hypothetical protein